MMAYVYLSLAIGICAVLALVIVDGIVSAAMQTSMGFRLHRRVADQFTPLGWTIMSLCAGEACILFWLAARGGA